MLQQKQVVTCFLESNGEILLLRRSEQVGSYRGKWAGVSGHVDKTADEQVLVEIAEEIGLSGEELKFIKRGKPLLVNDDKLDIKWGVHPYLFHIRGRDKIRIDWEHKKVRWVAPKDMDNYPTVPMLKETLARVYDS